MNIYYLLAGLSLLISAGSWLILKKDRVALLFLGLSLLFLGLDNLIINHDQVGATIGLLGAVGLFIKLGITVKKPL